ncbi:transcription termination/antitermination protein NusG [Candidatus Phytoplasma melaleucae]|uniref:Transcription termination/antitermination protein NusG n=1 Tax=Candidatus Phytoplasma melaleucae TaxID=2982630 RepID=A0ABT9DEI3_9MOLU|nr:transcription termination/antitermination protein NusG ['Melaleuca sp.' phytoplasma]MDO8168184.1 transcription termination/antitermination protein NusG ['Melaleuca sp.' phytoplasma]MDV3205422.1 transcription termination/antitermination protein NusG [Weeping tea tree witches'-broom phytoplasma]
MVFIKKEQIRKGHNIMNDEITKNNDCEAKWYIIQTYSGYENSVKEDLLRISNGSGITHNLILQVICPKEKNLKIRGGNGLKKEKEKLKEMYPGYIFIKMVMTDNSWYIVKSIPKVIGFLGSSMKKGKRSIPTPLSENEIKPILLKVGVIAKPNYDYLINRQIEIINGSFTGQQGRVSFVDYDQDKIIVEIDLFGRSTPIEISFASFKEIN